jgi:RND family efflux transporter MFP subunit
MKRIASISPFLVLVACRPEAAKIEKPPTPVHVTTAGTFTPRSGERYSATILPNRQVQMAFRVGGFVTAVYQVRGADGHTRNLAPGDIVQQGTVLAQLREKDYDLQISQVTGQLNEARQGETTAKAQLAQAQAAAGKAAQDFERAKFLYESKSLTKTDYDAAKAQHDVTRAQVDAASSQIKAIQARIASAEAGLATANLARADTAISAPFTAAVVQRNIDVGSLVGPGTPAYALAETSSVKASFGVSDRAAVRLHPGTRVPLFLEALPDRVLQGTVNSVAAVADSTTRLFQVEMIIPNASGVLRPGMIATVTIGGEAQVQPVTVVPLRAIVRSGDAAGGFAVMVVDRKQAHRRTVKLGETYGDNIAVGGVQTGERVISTGATLIGEGETVEVIP